MRVLLIVVNQERAPYPIPPLGAAYIASHIRQLGHDAELVDMAFVDDVQEALKDAIQSYEPDVIGFSMRNVDNVTWPTHLLANYVPAVKQIVSTCQELTNVPMIIGGSGYSLLPEVLLEHFDLQYGVLGDGELAMEAFLSLLQNGGDLRETPGLVWRENGAVHRNSLARLQDLTDYPWPARELMAGEGKIYKAANGSRVGNIQSKRGCPLSCTYCVYPSLEGANLRLRTPKDVVDELEHLKNDMNIDYIHFVDTIFNTSLDYAREICQQIVDRQLDIVWDCFFWPMPKNLPRDLIELIIQSGNMRMDFGIDAASEATLKGYSKPFTVSDVEEIVKRCHEVGAPFMLYLLLGGPNETEETLRETLDRCHALEPSAMLINTGIRVFPSTGLARVGIEQGVIPADHSFLEPVFYISPQLPPDWLDIVRPYEAAHDNWAVPGAAEDFEGMVGQLLKVFGEG